MPDTPNAIASIIEAHANIRGHLEIIDQEHANLLQRIFEQANYASNLVETIRTIRDKLLKYAEPGSTAEIDMTDLVDAHDLAAQAFAATPGRFKETNEDTKRLEFLLAHYKIDRAQVDNLRMAKTEIATPATPISDL